MSINLKTRRAVKAEVSFEPRANFSQLESSLNLSKYKPRFLNFANPLDNVVQNVIKCINHINTKMAPEFTDVFNIDVKLNNDTFLEYIERSFVISNYQKYPQLFHGYEKFMHKLHHHTSSLIDFLKEKDILPYDKEFRRLTKFETTLGESYLFSTKDANDQEVRISSAVGKASPDYMQFGVTNNGKITIEELITAHELGHAINHILIKEYHKQIVKMDTAAWDKNITLANNIFEKDNFLEIHSKINEIKCVDFMPVPVKSKTIMLLDMLNFMQLPINQGEIPPENKENKKLQINNRRYEFWKRHLVEFLVTQTRENFADMFALVYTAHKYGYQEASAQSDYLGASRAAADINKDQSAYLTGRGTHNTSGILKETKFQDLLKEVAQTPGQINLFKICGQLGELSTIDVAKNLHQYLYSPETEEKKSMGFFRRAMEHFYPKPEIGVKNFVFNSLLDSFLERVEIKDKTGEYKPMMKVDNGNEDEKRLYHGSPENFSKFLGEVIGEPVDCSKHTLKTLYKADVRECSKSIEEKIINAGKQTIADSFNPAAFKRIMEERKRILESKQIFKI